ncbi:hypothetical protein [Sphingomonas sp.]|uniref:hypothetical protein n=1 Tax=Sphingomonas sp. TaxID=28214 RepID=UPI001D7E4B6B|nr:hypothetical protein [Sphingomonas sp.]MBX9797086.1 hypothetical protein [Sphingomonas sp.]
MTVSKLHEEPHRDATPAAKQRQRWARPTLSIGRVAEAEVGRFLRFDSVFDLS